MLKYKYMLILVVGLVALCIYLLTPTYVDYQNNKQIATILQEKQLEIKKTEPGIDKQVLDLKLKRIEDSIRAANPDFKKVRAERIKLGLDLQGGMYVVLEVNVLKLLEKIAKNPDEKFKEIMKATEAIARTSDENVVVLFAKEAKARGMRLSRYFGETRDDDEKVLTYLTTQSEDAVKRALEIIRNRIDQYGLSEPTLQQTGSRRIIVELPGVAREEEARQLLQGTALLEFKVVHEPEYTIAIMDKLNKILAGKPLEDTTKKDTSAKTSKTDTTSVAKDTGKKDPNQMSEEEFKKEYPFYALAMLSPQSNTADAFVKENDKIKIKQILTRPDVEAIIPKDAEFVFSAKPEFTANDGSPIYRLFCLRTPPELTGGVITDARATLDPNSSAPIVTMAMNNEGAREWASITEATKGKRIAIVLDNAVFSAPVVRDRISGGNSQIDGMANLEEAKLLEIVLKAGALPAPVDIIEERTVGPSLGQDSIQKGLYSGLLGALLVVVFMVFYYRFAGFVADLAVIFNIAIILAVMAGFGSTLTLPGIAGIILTIGIAVDANILVNERIREEYATGKTLKAAISSGYSKALTAIIDSNITSIITGIILYQFGSGPVQGFALTLIFGLLSSMFTSLVVTKLIFNIMLEYGYSPKFG